MPARPQRVSSWRPIRHAAPRTPPGTTRRGRALELLGAGFGIGLGQVGPGVGPEGDGGTLAGTSRASRIERSACGRRYVFIGGNPVSGSAGVRRAVIDVMQHGRAVECPTTKSRSDDTSCDSTYPVVAGREPARRANARGRAENRRSLRFGVAGPAIVLGAGGRSASTLNEPACRAGQVQSIAGRVAGTVLLVCILLFNLVLRFQAGPGTQGRDGLVPLDPGPRPKLRPASRGTSESTRPAVSGLVSGNAQRRKASATGMRSRPRPPGCGGRPAEARAPGRPIAQAFVTNVRRQRKR